MPEFSLARTFRNRGLLLQTGSQFSNSASSADLFQNLKKMFEKSNKVFYNEIEIIYNKIVKLYS